MNAILDWRHETRSIPDAGLEVTREANEETRAALAEALEIEFRGGNELPTTVENAAFDPWVGN